MHYILQWLPLHYSLRYNCYRWLVWLDRSQVNGLSRQVLQVSGLTRQISQVSGLTRQVSQVSGLTRQVSQVSGLTRQVSQVSGLTRQVSQASGLTRQVSQVSGLTRQVNRWVVWLDRFHCVTLLTFSMSLERSLGSVRWSVIRVPFSLTPAPDLTSLER